MFQEVHVQFNEFFFNIDFRAWVFHLNGKGLFLSRSAMVHLLRIAHLTVVCLAIWPLSGSDAKVDFGLIQTFLVFTCKICCSYANNLLIIIIYM